MDTENCSGMMAMKNTTPKVVDDEDYCILEFIAEGGRFYRYDGKGDLSVSEIQAFDQGKEFENGYKALHGGN